MLGDGAEGARLPARLVGATWQTPCLDGSSWEPFEYSLFLKARAAPPAVVGITAEQLSAAAGAAIVTPIACFNTVHLRRITADGRATTDGPLHVGDVIRPCAGWAPDLSPAAAPDAGDDCATLPLLRIAAIIRATSAGGVNLGLCVGHEYGPSPAPMPAELATAATAFAPWTFREVTDKVRILPLAAIFDKRHVLTTRMAPLHATPNGRVLFTMKANGY